MRGIAIVGMACRYGGARSPDELWENVLAQRRAFRSIPPERLSRADYWSADRSAADKTYCDLAAVIEDYEFDRVRYRVSGEAFRSADMSHWLALDIATQALADAGFPEGTGLPRETTGVFLGNTLTGEFSRAASLRLRWPYVRRVVASLLAEQGSTPGDSANFLAELEVRFKAPFNPLGQESLAGGLSNTIAGRISNHLDLMGGAYVVDGACASSLLAVINACSALESGAIDVAIAGGVDLSLDPFELAGFARLGALATDEMRVFDARPSGFLPGEGCGMVVLIRQGDVKRMNARTYAVVRGWGIASDGKGGITRPEVEGQRLALRRAYGKAGFSIAEVNYFEAHGTGTEVGDAVELTSLIAEIREARTQRPTGEVKRSAVIGSTKPLIGHTKAAAGIAGLIKAAMVVRHGILPPTAGCKTPHPLFDGNMDVLRPAFSAEPAASRLRAGVSAMGFGGIDAHVVLESARTQAAINRPRRDPLLRSSQDAEVIFFGAADAAHMIADLGTYAQFAGHASFADVVDAAIEHPSPPCKSEVRCAAVGSSPSDLKVKLEKLETVLRSGATFHMDIEQGCFAGSGSSQPRVGFLFPGQAAPFYPDGGAWSRRFSSVERLYRNPRLADTSGIAGTDSAQVAVCLAELAALRVLSQLGIEASVAVGHSLGEIIALHWAGALNESSLLRLIRSRGEAMHQLCAPGSMLSVAAPAVDLPELGGTVIAALNSPAQTIVSGPEDAIRMYENRLRRSGLAALRLRVNRAFHSPSMEPCIERLRGELVKCRWTGLRRRVFSTVTGAELKAGADLVELLLDQVTSPVRFEQSVRAADPEVDLWVEVGPGRVLAGLVADISKKPVLSLDAGGSSLSGLLRCAASAYAAGLNLDTAPLFEDRFHRHISVDRRPVFFANPCESAPVFEAAPEPTPARTIEASDLPPNMSPRPALEELLDLVSARTELPLPSIFPASRMLSDLHLNSITVGQIVVETCHRMGIATPSLSQYADATLEAIAKSLDHLKDIGADGSGWEQWPAGIAPWVRAFYTETLEWLSPAHVAQHGVEGNWTIHAPREDSFLEAMRSELNATGTGGVGVYLPDQPSSADVALLLAAARSVVSGVQRFALLLRYPGAASFARALHTEFPEISTCVVKVSAGHAGSTRQVAADIAAAGPGYMEIHYDINGIQRRPVLKMFHPDGKDGFALGPRDVIAVTGGAKGITSECALALARDSGAKLLLLGRSDAETDGAIRDNLARMRSAGITVRYERVDLTDARAAQTALDNAQGELGSVTAVLHGAAVNEPRLLRDVDENAFAAAIAPKVNALDNVLAAIEASSLRLLVAFSSVVARTGLAGEAHYALANEHLAERVEYWSAAHPHCKALVVEWSLWAGVGMGVRLGRVDDLMRQGISPIGIEAGVDMLRRLISSRLPATTVTVAGRLGAPRTVRFDAHELPFYRFLEDPKVYIPEIELVADCSVSPASDPYVDDHVFDGQRLMPAVMALEALAQAAAVLSPAGGAFVFENVEFREALRIPDQQCGLRVAALKDEQGVVELVIRSSETQFQVDHVRASARRISVGAPRISSFEIGPVNLPNLSVQTDLYCDLFFQSGRFHRVIGYRQLSGFECVAELRVEPDERWYSAYLPRESELGDAGVRDAALHSIQAVIPHRRVLPVGVERITHFRAPSGTRAFAHAIERTHDRDSFIFDLEIAGEDHELIEVWQGLRLQAVERVRTDRITAEPLLAALIERELVNLCGASSRISVELRPGPPEFHTDASWNGLPRRPDGKLDPIDGLTLGNAHTHDVLVTIAGDRVSCDVENIEHRSAGLWESLLPAGGWLLANRITLETGEDLEVAATRVWTAAETLEKLGTPQPLTWLLEGAFDDGCVTFRAGAVSILTIVARIRQLEPVVIAVGAVAQRSRSEEPELASV